MFHHSTQVFRNSLRGLLLLAAWAGLFLGACVSNPTPHPHTGDAFGTDGRGGNYLDDDGDPATASPGVDGELMNGADAMKTSDVYAEDVFGGGGDAAAEADGADAGDGSDAAESDGLTTCDDAGDSASGCEFDRFGSASPPEQRVDDGAVW